MRNRWLMTTLLAMLTMLTVGCGQVHYIRYVRGVEFDPADAQGLPLDDVYVSNDVTRLKGAKVLVKFEDPAKTIDRDASKVLPKLDEPGNWEKMRKFFELGLTVDLKNSGEFSDVQRESSAADSFQPDAVLKVAITEWHEGRAWTRALIGLGAGRTRIQWEGVLTDARTGRVLFAFADARIHPGGPSALGFPRKVWHGEDLNADLMDEGFSALAQALRIVIETPPGE